MSQTVFYIWQSDSQNRTNRNFIEVALQRAIDGILEEELALEPVIDRDTAGLSGAPDVAQAILEKIDAATVVVADVSLINSGSASSPPDRLTPNPNVMFELGYAAAKLGWAYIVPVHNLATGQIEDLPFDIRQRRLVTYTADASTEDLPTGRKDLQRKLQAALTSCLQASARRAPRVALVYRSGRFGVRNSGTIRITVDRLVYRFPQTIHVNSGPPLLALPTIHLRDFGTVDGVQWWELVLERIPGQPGRTSLPDFVAAGETEIFEALPSFFGRDADPNAEVYIKLHFADGTVIEFRPTVGELVDPQGAYVVSPDR